MTNEIKGIADCSGLDTSKIEIGKMIYVFCDMSYQLDSQKPYVVLWKIIPKWMTICKKCVEIECEKQGKFVFKGLIMEPQNKWPEKIITIIYSEEEAKFYEAFTDIGNAKLKLKEIRETKSELLSKIKKAREKIKDYCGSAL